MDTVKVQSKNAKMVAHRGLSGIERENTCPAFIAAGNRSYFGIETDVHVTKDGKFVVIHDDTTERVCLGLCNVDVEKSTYENLKNIVIPDLDGSTHRQDIRIPLLKDYIKICKKYDKKCVLELKNDFEKNDIERMIKEISEDNYLSGVIFISFSFKNCVILRELLPQAKIQFLTGDKVDDKLIADLKAHSLDLDIYYKKLTKEVIDLLHENSIEVNCWTCDEKEAAEALADMGIDYITTNILE